MKQEKRANYTSEIYNARRGSPDRSENPAVPAKKTGRGIATKSGRDVKKNIIKLLLKKIRKNQLLKIEADYIYGFAL